jgi:hypothetical protein
MNRFVTGRDSTALSAELSRWLDESADGLDEGTIDPATILPMLSKAGLLRSGVPTEFGGLDGDITDAVTMVAAVSERSLAAGLVLWGHRTYIEYVLQSPNAKLRRHLLPRLLNGELAGASGLSNAMKFISGIEDLQVWAQRAGNGYVLNGKLNWVTNLRPEGFHAAVAVKHADGEGSFIASLASGDQGIQRSPDLDLMGLRSTNTAAIAISSAPISEEQVLHPNAEEWLPTVRPAFLGLQIGMSIGLARRALSEAHKRTGAGRHLLEAPIAKLAQQLSELERSLLLGLRSGVFQTNPNQLFEIRIALADAVTQAIALELHACGGSAYLSTAGRGFARRWREAAFIPIITPSVVQLKLSLAQHKENADQAPPETSDGSSPHACGIE